MLKSKIERYYEKHSCKRVSQGDILRDFSFILIGKDCAQVEITFPYIVVFSQDCDLEHGSKIIALQEEKKDTAIEFNQYLHNILFCPAFTTDTIRAGTHLKDVYNIQTTRINSSQFDAIKKKENPRYHLLQADMDLQVPELIIDFKAYYTVPFDFFNSLYMKYYLATTNELFRESLSQRFSYYLSRIGLPEI